MGVIGGVSFLKHNFWTNSSVLSLVKGENTITTIASAVLSCLPGRMVGAGLIVVPTIILTTLLMGRLPNPFFPMAVVLFVTQVLFFSPQHALMDYQLIFLIPALYGVVFGAGNERCSRESAQGASPDSQTGTFAGGQMGA